MNRFVLDPRLQQDCVVLGDLPLSVLLLMNDARFPWFILVPRVTVVELHALEASEYASLGAEIRAVSHFVQTAFDIDKLNVAAIGNRVRQLHVHIVGRRVDDPCWPGVVWGCSGREPYGEAALAHMRTTADQCLAQFGSDQGSAD